MYQLGCKKKKKKKKKKMVILDCYKHDQSHFL